MNSIAYNLSFSDLKTLKMNNFYVKTYMYNYYNIVFKNSKNYVELMMSVQKI